MRQIRVERLNNEFKKEIYKIISSGIKDPRLTAMVSVMDVNITNDLSYADVYVSLMGEEEEKQQSFEVITNSAGYIRKLLGKRFMIRKIPQLRFKLDDQIEQGMKISKLIDEVNKDSKESE